MDNADILIIGGGAAGAVLAARLSENPSLRVVLVEAGKDTPPGNVPDDIADTFPTSYANIDYFWPGVKASVQGRHRAPTLSASPDHGWRLERDGHVGASRPCRRL